MLADLARQARGVALRHVGRVRHHHVHRLLRQRRQQIAGEEADARAQPASVVRRHADRAHRDVGGPDLGRALQGKGYRDRPRAASHIHHAAARAAQRQRGFDDMLGLGPRDQHVRADAERTTVELLLPGDVLRGLAVQPFVQIAPVVKPDELGQLLLRMGVEKWPFASQGVAQQHFGRQPRSGDGGLLKKLGSLPERGLDGHRRRDRKPRSAVSVSPPGNTLSTRRPAGPAALPSPGRADTA